MATEGISLAAWKEQYLFALLETDPARLPRKVADAHSAICDRIRELDSSPSCEEYLALKSALRLLRILEKETLDKRKTA